MTSSPVRRRRLALAAVVVAAVLGGGTVVAGAATPSPSPRVDQAEPLPFPAADDEADKAARKAARHGGQAAPGADPTGPAFVCDPALSHGRNVSAYARSLPKGPGRGRLVSQAARSACGKPSDD